MSRVYLSGGSDVDRTAPLEMTPPEWEARERCVMGAQGDREMYAFSRANGDLKE